MLNENKLEIIKLHFMHRGVIFGGAKPLRTLETGLPLSLVLASGTGVLYKASKTKRNEEVDLCLEWMNMDHRGM
jgi:hypothetical protein